jgi:hypothetical protein
VKYVFAKLLFTITLGLAGGAGAPQASPAINGIRIVSK